MQKAFDLIIDKIKEEKASYFLTIANTGDEKLDAIYKAVANAIDRDIEIVNQVAEEYKQKVCEWKYKDAFGFSNCRFAYDEIDSDNVNIFEFCPYCGKKIKVV